jgi:hypothetical protein
MRRQIRPFIPSSFVNAAPAVGKNRRDLRANTRQGYWRRRSQARGEERRKKRGVLREKCGKNAVFCKPASGADESR